MERDDNVPQTITLIRISTHTLTWSVTERRVKIIENKVISTHTLTWSVTETAIILWSNANFNSHAHVERDGDGT